MSRLVKTVCVDLFHFICILYTYRSAIWREDTNAIVYSIDYKVSANPRHLVFCYLILK